MTKNAPPLRLLLATLLALSARAEPATAWVPAAAKWTELTSPPIERATAIYDSLRDRLLVFGGDRAGGHTHDLWEVRLSAGTPRWQRLEPTGAPPDFVGSSAVYDARRDRMLVFGVFDPYFIDGPHVWELTLGDLAWRRIPMPNRPAPYLMSCTVMMDARRDRVLLFGGHTFGYFGAGASNQVWALNLDPTPVFEELRPAGPLPGARGGQIAAFDPLGDRIVVYSGFVVGPDPTRNRWDWVNDAWELSLSPSLNWVRLADGPSPRSTQAAVFDPVGKRLILHGGRDSVDAANGETWSLSWATGVSAWSRLPIPSTARYHHFAVLDTRRDRMIIGGGNHPQPSSSPRFIDGLFALNLTSPAVWDTLIPPSFGPGYPSGPVRVLDTRRDRVILAFGENGQAWSRAFDDDATWTALAPEGCPALTGASGVYDPVGDRVVCYGGMIGSNYNTRTWEMTLGASPRCRELLPPQDGPGNKTYFGAAYDPAGRRMIVCGGPTPVGSAGPIWALDLAGSGGWQALPLQSPLASGPVGHRAFYDPERHRLVVSGGERPGNEVWVLDLSSSRWSSFIPISNFNYYVGDEVLYDSACDCLLSARPAPSGVSPWTAVFPLTPGGERWGLIPTPAHAPLGSFVMVYSPARGEALALGGATGIETWRLRFDSPTPTLASVVRTWATPHSASVVWRLSEPAEAEVFRSEGAGFWSAVARVAADGQGEVNYQDDDVRPGRRYGYRLQLAAGGSAFPLGEVWIETPLGLTFSLEAPRPNPVIGDLRITFSLATEAPATLEIFDVSGRRIRSRHLATPGAGQHSVTLARRGELLPGIYWARLIQGLRRSSARLVVAK